MADAELSIEKIHVLRNEVEKLKLLDRTIKALSGLVSGSGSGGNKEVKHGVLLRKESFTLSKAGYVSGVIYMVKIL